jgi:heparanase 1
LAINKQPVRVTVGPTIRQLPEGFLSVSIDMSQLLAGLWWEGSSQIVRGLGTEAAAPVDFSDQRLIAGAKLFSGGMLRIGGTASDKATYRVDCPIAPGLAQEELVLSGGTWQTVSNFCEETGLSLMMTLNCGRDTWNPRGEWDPTNALELLRFDAGLKRPTSAWALGNEINGYPFVHGIRHFMSARRYCRAYQTFSDLVAETHPFALKAGPASAFWPRIGEPNPKINAFLKCVGDRCDIVTWHYYPVHSHRGSFSTRWASPEKLLAPRNLDEIRRFSRRIGDIQARRGFAGKRWLGELGPALYGGEPGLSDRYISGLWWLDALSSAAMAGEERVFRQTLFGSEYGLLRSEDYAPNPDFWNCLLWKSLMGSEVWEVQAAGAPPALRLYAHGDRERQTRTLLALNVSMREPAQIDLLGLLGDASKATLFYIDSPDPYSRELRINGAEPSEAGDDVFALGTPLVRERLSLAPLSYCFVLAELP